VGRHVKRKDLVFQTVVLGTLVRMALVAVQNEQPRGPKLVHLYIRVKVFQPLQIKRVICLSILRN
jgi:hypothetical protein